MRRQPPQGRGAQRRSDSRSASAVRALRAPRREVIAPLTAAGFCLLLGWQSFVRGGRIPVLSLVDLGFHELGHMVTYPLPDLTTAIMGSVVQVAVPAGLGAYFGLARGEWLAAAVCLAWAGTAAHDVSIYIADAPFERLDLLGGGEHDWAYTLSELGWMDRAAVLAAAVRGYGIGMLVAALAMCTPQWRQGHVQGLDPHFGQPAA